MPDFSAALAPADGAQGDAAQGDADAAAAAAAAAGGGSGEGAAAGGGDADAFAWAGELSNEALAGGKPSDKDWLTNKGYKSPADMISAMRALEGHVNGRLAMPKDENDTDGWNALYKAIGRPDTPDGYEFKTEDGSEDPRLTEFAKAAHDLGISKKQMDGLAAALDGVFTQSSAAEEARINADFEAGKAELRTAWGENYDRNVEIARRGAEKFGFDKDLLNALGDKVGVKKMLEMMHGLGKAMGEDTIDGNPSKLLGGMDAKTAQAELDAMAKDPVKAKALTEGTDPTLAERRKQLLDIVAADYQKQISG